MRLLVLLALFAAGCTLPAEDTDMLPMAPWHMWGTGQTFDLLISAQPSTNNQTSGQLVRVSYKRPETWHWLFAAQVLAAPASASIIEIAIDYTLIVGLGRSQTTLPGFTGFGFRGAANALQASQARKWTTVALAPLQNDFAVVPFQPTLDHIVAEDIQVSCVAVAYQPGGGALVGQSVKIQVDAYLAPLSHVRPDWYADLDGDDERFLGNEDGGT